jgi:single-strand DNA-binding protein
MSLFDLNRATLIGNVTRDPELKYTAKGTAVINFSIATNRRIQSEDGQYKDSPTFHNIVAWSKTAERLAKVMSKGQKVYVEGRIDNRSYEKDGQTRYITEIVADNVIVFDRSGRAAGGGNVSDFDDTASAAPAPARAAKKKAPEKETADFPESGDMEEVDPNDIPF